MTYESRAGKKEAEGAEVEEVKEEPLRAWRI
jgi:hypothetical protein